MIESTEAVVVRQQPETASKDGQKEATEASKFRKLLSSLSKGGSADGMLEDLFAALAIEPLSASKMQATQKKDEKRKESEEKKLDEEPVEYVVDLKDQEDVKVSKEPTIVVGQEIVAVKKVEDVQVAGQVTQESEAAEQKTVSELPLAANVTDVNSSDAIQIAGLQVPEPDLEQITEKTVSSAIQAGENQDAGTLVEGSVKLVSDKLVSDVNTKPLMEASVQQEEGVADNVVSKTEVNLNIQSVPAEVVAVAQGVATVTNSLEVEQLEKTEAFVGVQSDSMLPKVPNELPVVEGLLQLRALIERVSKGVGAATLQQQVEFQFSKDKTEHLALAVTGAVKEASGLKIVPNGLVEKSNRGLSAPKEKATAIPERLISKMMERLEQVAKEVERSKDGRSISFRLDPPQLGKVRVDMVMKDGSIHTRLTAESALVAQFLRERGDELQALIRKVLPHLDQATVSFGGSSGGDHSGSQMNFSGGSFNGFLNNGTSEGDAGVVANEKHAKERRRELVTSSGASSNEIWVA